MPGTYVPGLPRTNLGKRRRSGEETNDESEARKDRSRRSAPKRVKRKTDANGVSGALESTSRARKKPATGTPVKISHKSDAAGRGAEMLAAPVAHEVYHRFQPGPSVQEALVGTVAQGQLSWIQEREESTTSNFAGNAVGQQGVVNTAADEEAEVAEEGGFRIPAKLKDRSQLLLVATPEERARGVVPVLRCVMCPDARLSEWESFIRHCERSEAHPEFFELCSFCADFFARKDACKRHEEKPPSECTIVSPAEAEVKRTVTLEVHKGFERDLDAHLRFGRALGEPFVQRLKKLFPNSCKRGSRQQNQLKS